LEKKERTETKEDKDCLASSVQSANLASRVFRETLVSKALTVLSVSPVPSASQALTESVEATDLSVTPVSQAPTARLVLTARSARPVQKERSVPKASKVIRVK